jgi:hypothetical protein
MTVPTVACTNCGKNFTTDDLRGTSCRYCGTVLAHHARAAQQVAVVNQMLADRNGNGIPDAYEGLVANAQANAMNQAFGMPYAANPYAAQNPYAAGNPYQNPVMMQGPYQAQQVGRALSRVAMIMVVATILVVVLTFGIGLASFFLLR